MNDAPSPVDLNRAMRLWLRDWRDAGLAEFPAEWLRSTGTWLENAPAAESPRDQIIPPQTTTVPAPRQPSQTSAAASPFQLPRNAVSAPSEPAVLERAANSPSYPPLAEMPPKPRSAAAATTPSVPTVAKAATNKLSVTAGGTRNERLTKLDVVNNKVRSCVRCDELARTRNKTVFGVGNPEARLLFIGEAPGADEDEQGEPFVGKAGQLLDKIIAACGFKRQDLYICNVLKCRPPGNRTPAPEECANCREYLDAQLTIIDPEFIVCWGAVAATNLLGVTTAIGKLRKTFHTHGRAKVLCTYHPSYLLRNPPAKKDVWEDMQLLLAEMGLPVPNSGG